MIKKILLAAALALPMLASAQTVKIGIVDIDEVFQKMPDTDEAQKKLADVSKKYEDEYGKLQEEMKRRYDEIQAMPDDELPAIKDRKIKDFQEYQQKVAQFEQSAGQELQKVQSDLITPIYTKINNAVQSVGQEGGFSLIEAKVATLVLYYSSPVIDITNEVKAKLGIAQ